MTIYQCPLTQNKHYNSGITIIPKGIVVHSSGCNQTWLGRFVQPSEGAWNYDEMIALLGYNGNKNSWNRPGVDKLVHYMIGLNDAEDEVIVVQTAPCTLKGAGVASGVNGSFNNSHIQFEMLEDNLKDEDYFNRVMQKGIELCAHICKEYNLPVTEIYSHKECAALGYGVAHGDPENWLTKFGKDMNWFRAEVEKMLTPSVSMVTIPQEEYNRMTKLLSDYSVETAKALEAKEIAELKLEKAKNRLLELFEL